MSECVALMSSLPPSLLSIRFNEVLLSIVKSKELQCIIRKVSAVLSQGVNHI